MKARQLMLASAVLAGSLLSSGCVGLLVGGTAAVGVGMAHDRRTTGTLVDDQTIGLKVTAALDRQLPSGNRISATSYNAVVLLTGEAASEDMRRQAEFIARGVMPPPREVYNEVVVSPPSPLSARSNDALLTTKAKAALFKIQIKDFDPTRVKVVTDRSVVYLLGLVRPNEGDAAANVVSQIGGVHQVVTLFEFIN
ncbi:MAG: BON domain-containing protein [Candidatus Competibacter denitrificans]